MAKLKLFLLIIAILIISGVLAYLILSNFNINLKDLPGNGEISEGNNGAGTNAEVFSKDNDLPGGTESVSSDTGSSGAGGSSAGGSSGGGGGGGSASSEGGSSSGEVCEDMQIPYALKNFEENSICNEFENGICVNKNFTCSLEVYNLDEKVGGIFKLRFVIFERGTYNELDSNTKEFSLNAEEYEKVETSFDLLGEEANKEIDCRFFKESAPKKEICE